MDMANSPPESPSARSPTKRRLLYLFFFLFFAALIALTLNLSYPKDPVQVVGPGALIAEVSRSDFANAYYRMLQSLGGRITSESGSGYGLAGNPQLIRSERCFATPDQVQVIVSTTSEGQRQIVFITFQPARVMSTADAQAVASSLTEALATHIRQEADSRRFSQFRRLLRWR
jgi:hypothetical protein